MQNQQWEAIHSVFMEIDRLCSALKAPLQSVYAALLPVEQEEKEGEVHGSEYQGDIVRVRNEIRTQLDFLRARLSEHMTEHDCYLVLFPIVVHFDELVQTSYLEEQQTNWPSLQKELFQTDKGGQLFYDTLDDILRKPQTSPFIYEVYYLCLNHGFRGRYNDDPVKITEYKNKLRNKIPVTEAEAEAQPMEISGGLRHVGSAVWYYVAAGVSLVVIYLLLYGFANYWNDNLPF